MTQLRCALVGLGYSGRTFHLPLIRSVSSLQLAAIVSGNAALAAQVAPGTEVRELPAVLSDPSIELIVIATPNASHFPLARDALLANKHVVVDKPFTVTLAEAVALAKLASERGRLITAFQNRRWDADLMTL